MIPIRIADDVFEIKVPSPQQAQALALALRDNKGFEDVVAGLSSVCIKFEPASINTVFDALCSFDLNTTSAEPAHEICVIPIRYGGHTGPDLDAICDQLGISSQKFVDLHTSCSHRVDMIGFTPGFSYISGLPEDFQIPRLSKPRPRVSAGSVGVSGSNTGLYAMAGPGGWPLVGVTDKVLFAPSSSEPFLLSPGQTVRFEAV